MRIKIGYLHIDLKEVAMIDESDEFKLVSPGSYVSREKQNEIINLIKKTTNKLINKKEIKN